MPENTGVVIKSTGSWYLVKDKTGQIFECRLKGKLRLEGFKSTNPVAIGDRVIFSHKPDGSDAVISKIEERKNYLIRKASNLSKQTHIIAANIDRAFAIVSLKKPAISSAFIDRFLVLAQAYGIEPVIVFNKIDLYNHDMLYRLEYLEDQYTRLGYNCLGVSAKTGMFLESLIELLDHKTSLLIGQSGVGKSSIINRINPDLHLKTKEISNYHKKGTHTTTFYQMHELMPETYVIDSPGIRELGLYGFEKNEISLFFPEIKNLATECRYNNCLHLHEPECAVIKAVEAGEISDERYINYLKILDDFEL